MKAIINNLTEQFIEVDFGTERVYRDLAKDKPDIIYCYELTKLNIPSNYSIRDNLGWLFELDSITNIKLYNDTGDIVQETSSYHTVEDIRVSPENDLNINTLVIRIV